MSFPKALLICAAFLGLAGCNMAVSRAPIIDEYKAATCVPASMMKGPNPPSREWNATLKLLGGSHVTVIGAESPGGRISVHYEMTGRNLVAADAGDYVYPSDVRVNLRNDHLYIKASGLAGGIWQETWLFEYDLQAQRPLKRQKVEESALPPECAATQQ